MQDTPPRPKIPIPGLGTTDQLMPSQDSITVPEPLRPAAVHTVAETQDTPERPLSGAGLGLGRTEEMITEATPGPIPGIVISRSRWRAKGARSRARWGRLRAGPATYAATRYSTTPLYPARAAGAMLGSELPSKT
jgi:hypothetical protein